MSEGVENMSICVIEFHRTQSQIRCISQNGVRVSESFKCEEKREIFTSTAKENGKF